MKNLNSVLHTFEESELNITWTLTKSAALSFSLPILIGMIGCELSFTATGKFILELLMTFILIEVQHSL